ELGESIESLGVRAFAGCSSLREARLDCRVESLPAGLFEGCENLQTVMVGGGIRDLGSVEGHPFGQHPNIVSFHLGRGARSIPGEYFAFWPRLEKVTLPDSARAIGAAAFAGCPVLSHVSYSGNAPTAGRDMYEGTPEGLTSWVEGGSTGWNGNAGSLALPETWQGRSIRRWGAAEYAERGEAVPQERTETGNVPVVWLDEYDLARDGDYEKAAAGAAANQRPAWECYVAGLDPTNPASDFKVRLVSHGGAASLEWTPDLSRASDKRAYRVMGKKVMESTEWTEVTDAGDWVAEGWRFFQVRVALPE
ncbi:MAG: leucine-rich repeat protein, partial [Kiritimatiellae bacterium]|nr:leucine-rich repeat protein [Kiritimatiellia bacterium]